MSRIRSYREVSRLTTFEDRFAYLVLRGEVGKKTFGFDRWLNQQFYQSREWKLARDEVIARDLGCDLGVLGYEIHDGLLVHHINPLTPEDIYHGLDLLIDTDNLITTTQRTHNAIHFGDATSLPQRPVERKPGDTKLW